MIQSMRKIIKDKTTEELKEHQKQLYQKILYKQKLLNKYNHLIVQMEGNCSGLIEEYERIDRTVFFRENRVTLVENRKKEKKETKLAIEKNVGDLTKRETSDLL